MLLCGSHFLDRPTTHSGRSAEAFIHLARSLICVHPSPLTPSSLSPSLLLPSPLPLLMSLSRRSLVGVGIGGGVGGIGVGSKPADEFHAYLRTIQTRAADISQTIAKIQIRER